MIFGLFVLGVALTISAVAAYYSIAGLCAIFAAAVVPIIIMGAALELGKITATVWLHKYWHRVNIQFKLYLVPAIIVLMLITSMGIFGFLSKAHMDQNITVGDSSAQVSILDEKIKTEQDNIAANKKALQQMDAQVDQMLGRTTDDKGASKAVQVRKSQAKERTSIQADIGRSQKTIAQLQEERAPLAAKARKIEAEVGPIKYIAALIYGDNPDANLLERAVRWVIILLVFVFDPLALILILAAEQTIIWSQEDKKKKDVQDKQREGWHQEWVPDTEAWPEWDDTITDEQYEAIKQEANIDDDIAMQSFFNEGKELAKAIDANDGYLNKPWAWGTNATKDGLVPKVEEPVVVTLPEVVDGTSAEEFIQQLNEQLAHASEHHDPEPLGAVRQVVITDSPHDPEPHNTVTVPDMSISAEETPVNAGFGIQFPTNPDKGDMFLRVDYLPNRPYKWNGIKWIEVDKTKTDSFAYDDAYIQYLIEKLDSGEYDVDLLSPAEQEQIQGYLNGKSKQ